MRTVRLSPCACANGTARAKADRESARMVFMNAIVLAILSRIDGWSRLRLGAEDMMMLMMLRMALFILKVERVL
jgi:hypothetical protein